MVALYTCFDGIVSLYETLFNYGLLNDNVQIDDILQVRFFPLSQSR